MKRGKIFCYAARTATAIAAGGSLPVNINFNNDSDFVLSEIRTTGTASLRLMIAEASGRQYSNISLTAAIFGTGDNKVMFPTFPDPTLIPANTQLIVTFIDGGGAGLAAGLEVQLWGYQVPKGSKEQVTP